MRELRPYLRLIGGYRGRLGAGALLMLATTGAAAGLLALSGWFIIATGVTGLALAAGAAMTLDIYTPAAGIRAFAILRTVARYGERLVHHDATLRILATLRTRVFAGLTHLDPATAAEYRSGEILNRLTADVDALDQLYLRALAPPLVTVAALTGLALLAGWIDPALSLLPSIGLGTVAVAVALAGVWAGTARGRAITLDVEALRRRAIELIDGLAPLRIYGSLRQQRRSLERGAAKLDRNRRGLALRQAAGEAVMTFAVRGAALSALALGLSAYAAGHRSAAVAVLVALAVLGLGELLGALPAAFLGLGRTRAAAGRLNRQMRANPRLEPPERPRAPPASGGLSLSRVRFAYGSAGEPVLDGLDLDIAEGERTIVTGRSGCGKSTLTDLVCRLADPVAGTVCFAGIDLRRIESTTLRRRIGYLPQQSHLFADTIAENLRLAAPEAGDSLLWQALWTADLDRRVATMPDGLDTHLASGGTGLSGGEARRLTLARLLLADTPTVVLDEPLSGLDTATAQRVAQRLERWLGGRTALIVAHEGTTLPGAHRHLRLERGRLLVS